MEKRMTNPKSEGYISAKDMAGRAAYYKVLQAAKNGELTRIKRGVYATDDHLASQMLDVEKVVPGGVLCLYSAWSHYQLTTQVPQEYCLAIKRGRNSRKRKTFSMGDVEFQMEQSGCFRLDWTFCRIKVLIMAIYFQ